MQKAGKPFHLPSNKGMSYHKLKFEPLQNLSQRRKKEDRDYWIKQGEEMAYTSLHSYTRSEQLFRM